MKAPSTLVRGGSEVEGEGDEVPLVVGLGDEVGDGAAASGDDDDPRRTDAIARPPRTTARRHVMTNAATSGAREGSEWSGRGGTRFGSKGGTGDMGGSVGKAQRDEKRLGALRDHPSAIAAR
ncbi:MAG: hypothetical protein ACRDG8_09020 [Actinomycetota bacterium]